MKNCPRLFCRGIQIWEHFRASPHLPKGRCKQHTSFAEVLERTLTSFRSPRLSPLLEAACRFGVRRVLAESDPPARRSRVGVGVGGHCLEAFESWPSDAPPKSCAYPSSGAALAVRRPSDQSRPFASRDMQKTMTLLKIPALKMMRTSVEGHFSR